MHNTVYSELSGCQLVPLTFRPEILTSEGVSEDGVSHELKKSPTSEVQWNAPLASKWLVLAGTWKGFNNNMVEPDFNKKS